MGKKELIDIAVIILVETDAAYKVSDGKTEGWVPKSQVEWDADDGIMVMPLWLAKEKEFV